MQRNIIKIALLLIIGVGIFSSKAQEVSEWKPLGPFFPYLRSLKPAGIGWVDAIWSDPKDRSHLLIGARSGGLWETKDLGNTWKCLTGDLPVYGVFCIDVNPNDPNEILLGTGMTGGGFHKFQHHTQGIFKSTDAGKSWNLSNSPKDKTVVTELERDPFNPTHLLALYIRHSSAWRANGGEWSGGYLVESWDGGSTWTKKLVEIPDRSEIREIKFSPYKSRKVYLSGRGLFLESNDSGKTWEDKFQELVLTDSLERLKNEKGITKSHLIAMDIARFGDKETLYLFAHYPRFGNAPNGNKLYKFKEGEKPIMIPHPRTSKVSTRGRVGRVLVRSCPWEEDLLFYGKTNLSVVSWNPDEKDFNLKKCFSPRGQLHDDLRDLVVIDTNHILAGTDGGFMISENGGRAWKYIMGDGSSENSINNTEFYDFDAEMFKGKPFMIGGAQDNSSFMYYDGKWVQHGAGDGGVCKVLSVNDTSIYFSLSTNYFTRLGKMDSFPYPKFQGNFSYASSLYDRVIFPVSDLSDIYIIGKVPDKDDQCSYPSRGSGKGTRNKILSMSGVKGAYKRGCFYGSDFLELKGYPEEIKRNWNAKTPLKPPYSNINVVSGVVGDPDIIYFSISDWGGTDFSLFKTADRGQNWENLTPTLSKDINRKKAHISDILIDPNNTKHVWICFSHFLDGQKIFESRDGGFTWKNISKGLEFGNVPCNDLDYDSENRVLYVGNDNGVYYVRTNSNFTGWKRLNKGLPMVRVTHLKVVPKSGKLFAATWGRGVWESPLLEKSEDLGPETGKKRKKKKKSRKDR